MIQCRALGPVDITVDGAPAPPELLWRKNLALLLYLARSPARRRTRDHVIGLLWGDRHIHQGRTTALVLGGAIIVGAILGSGSENVSQGCFLFCGESGR